MLCYVTRYDPKTREPGAAVPIEADSKAEAARKVCGFKVAPAPVSKAEISVSCLGEKPNEREYFRKA